MFTATKEQKNEILSKQTTIINILTEKRSNLLNLIQYCTSSSEIDEVKKWIGDSDNFISLMECHRNKTLDNYNTTNEAGSSFQEIMDDLSKIETIENDLLSKSKQMLNLYIQRYNHINN